MGAEFQRHLMASLEEQELLDRVDVHATAKARTQDSAKAFMQGMCGGTHTYTDPSGKEGITGHDRTVHISHEGHDSNYTIHARPKHEDPLLRFFDMCPAYDAYVAKINADFLKAWEHEQWSSHVPRLSAALQLPEGRLTERNVDALWHLCQQEAGLWGINHQACSLFSPQEAAHMEWVDDVQMFMRKGAASPVAYHMAAPLLADIANSLQNAAKGTFQQAKLCFAHAETIVPLACLLGLFGPQQPKALLTQPPFAPQCSADSDLQQASASKVDTDQQPDHGNVHGNHSVGDENDAKASCQGTSFSDSKIYDSYSNGVTSWLPPLPQPPRKRDWHGSMIAPYGANIQFRLHRSEVLGSSTPDHIVEVLYNGVPLELPGCHTNQKVISLQNFLDATTEAQDPAAFDNACRAA